MVLVKCNKCGYSWNYKGNSKIYVSCPSCLTKIKIIDCLQEIISFEIIKKVLSDPEKFFEKNEITKEEFMFLLLKYIKIKEKILKRTGEGAIELGEAIKLFNKLYPKEVNLIEE